MPVCSEFTARELGRLFPDLTERALHIPLGADDDLPAAPPRAEARRALRVAGPLLLAVGAILNRRCVPELLRAVVRLRERYPGLLLDLVGENRTHPRLDLEALVASLGLRATVRLSGFVDDAALATRYAAADVFVALSEYEGFGLPALEAATRGVPLVVGRPPSLGEIFKDAALVVDPRDEAAVARAIERVLGGAARRARRSWRRARRSRDATPGPRRRGSHARRCLRAAGR